jgi:hypothetical protein
VDKNNFVKKDGILLLWRSSVECLRKKASDQTSSNFENTSIQESSKEEVKKQRKSKRKEKTKQKLLEQEKPK